MRYNASSYRHLFLHSQEISRSPQLENLTIPTPHHSRDIAPGHQQLSKSLQHKSRANLKQWNAGLPLSITDVVRRFYKLNRLGSSALAFCTTAYVEDVWNLPAIWLREKLLDVLLCAFLPSDVMGVGI